MAKGALSQRMTVSSRVNSKPSAPRRPRSLGGCATCRSRHTRCDEGRPSCLVCQRLGLTCERYEIRLVFNANETHGSRYRRPLFTEDMRQKMSDELIASVNPENLNIVLMEMDERCEASEQESGFVFTTYSGPFGAFRVPPQLEASEESIIPMPKSPLPSSRILLGPEGTYSSDPLIDSFFGNFDLDAASMDFQAEGFLSTLWPSPGDIELWSPEYVGEESRRPVERHSSSPVESPLLSSQAIRAGQDLSSLAPPDAPFLLSVYKDYGIRLFSPVQFEKSPWHILHLPSAMETLGQLTMGELPANAKMCTFCGILSTSCYQQRNTATSQSAAEYWQKQADLHANQAQNYLRSALLDASSPHKLVKYKDILIALLCMNTVSAYQGNQEAIRRCMIDCENWIRFRGLPKINKSRKVRLLHHCYVYLRIFHESTSILPIPYPTQEQEISSTPETLVSASSSGSFRLRQWEGRLDQRMNELKEPRTAENDLLLEIPGRWDSTMYPQIFGVPESLVFLLAQVTRLGNERDLLDAGSRAGTLDFRQFSTRARCLERCISIWRPPCAATEEESYGEDQRTTIPNMLNALHKAVLIFFYRRIYNVEADMLQDKVREIKDSLAQCDREDVPAARLAAAFVWSAFIAACEALDPMLQEWFTKWFEISAARSGLRTFKIGLSVAKQVWERRGVNSNADCSWPQVIRESTLNLLYI